MFNQDYTIANEQDELRKKQLGIQPIDPYGSIAPPSETSGPLQPVQPNIQPPAVVEQPSVQQSQQSQIQPGGAEYMNQEAANPVSPTDQPNVQPNVQQNQPQPGSAEYLNQEAANPILGHALDYHAIQHDPGELLNFSKKEDVPQGLKDRARMRAGELLATERDKNLAIQKVQQMQPTDLANALKERTSGGSWPKALIYGLLGMNQSSQDEAAKLGIGRDTPMLGADGKSYMVKVAANGTPLEGFSAETGKKLTPEDLVNVASYGQGMAGAQTSQTMGFDSNGNTISHTVLKNGQVVWKDQTNNKILSGAPEGYHTGKNQQEAMAIQAYKQTRARMEAANNNEVKNGRAPTYTLQQIEDEAQRSKAGVMGLPTQSNGNVSGTGAIAPAATVATPNTTPTQGQTAADWAKANNIPVSNNGGNRSTQDQANQLAQWYAGGMKGVRPAEPGMSKHETGDAIDVPKEGRTPENLAKLKANGFVNNVKGDPWHFERVNTPQPGVGNPSINDIQLQNAQAIANYQAPPLTGSGMNGQNAIIMAKVRELNPNYNANEARQKIKENQNIINSFSDSSKPASKSLQALKTATNHISDLMPTIDNLQNGKYPSANAIMNAFDKYTGGTKVTNMEAIGPAVGAEIMKSFNPAMGTEAERKHIAAAFDAARNPEQLKEAVKLYEGLMVGKLKPLADDYERTGRKDFWSTVVKDPAVKNMYDKHIAEQNVRNNIPVNGTTSTGVKFKVIK